MMYDEDDDWEWCPDCCNAEPYRWFCLTCDGQGGWDPRP